MNLLFQIGGNDQLGNMITGHDLIKKATGKSVYGKFFEISEHIYQGCPFQIVSGVKILYQGILRFVLYAIDRDVKVPLFS